MPRIATLANGMSIFVYAADHAPPHFHVRGPDTDVQIRIADLGVIRGSIPRRAFGIVETWATAHRDLLIAAWRDLNERD